MSHVDTPSPITHVSLCAGYGGIDLGLKRAIRNLRTIAVSEIEAFACANLVAKMEAGLLDPAPIWTDLKTFPWSDFRDRVDILSGGYPCQPFSAAGKRLGAEDPRHLWPFISAGIAAMRPSACFFENVDGHISMGLPDVLQDLAGLGYRATWCVASASECGAPHQRRRVFILAYRNEPGWQAGWHNAISSQGRQPHELAACGGDQRGAEELALTSSLRSAAGFPRPQQRHEGIAGVVDHCGDQAWPSRPGEQQFAWEPPRVVADSPSDRLNGSLFDRETIMQAEGNATAGSCAWPSRPGEQQFAWEPPRVCMGDPKQQHDVRSIRADELPSGQRGIRSCGQPFAQTGGQHRQTKPPLGRNPDGPADRLDDAELYTTCDNRTDELRLLGNGVVPAVAERAFRTLVSELVGYSESQ